MFNRGSSEEFAEHLAKLKTLAPDKPDVMLLEAAASHRQGDTAGAMALADKAFQIAPSSTTAIALANYKAAGGDVNAALKVYNKWLEDHPDDLAVRMAIANTLQMTGREEAAARQYEQVLKADADNAVALNNLAWILREQTPEKALEYARRASNIAPDSGEVLDTLAVIEYLNKDYKRAIRTIERALKASPDNPSIVYHSAMITAADGDETTARNILKRLIEAGKDYPESEQARALLAELEN
jgi:Flp pilus assembly protein TadD